MSQIWPPTVRPRLSKERPINKLTCPDVAKRILNTPVILAGFLEKDENSPNISFLCTLIECQQELNKAYKEAWC
jgi:hypothetical protein